MFIRLFEKLRKVSEVVATANPQKIVKDYYKDKSTKLVLSTWPSERESHQYKFWILQDGTIIPVVYSHAKTIAEALPEEMMDELGYGPVTGRKFTNTGAVAAQINELTKELGIDASKKLTSKQIFALRNLGIEYKVASIVAEIGRKDWESPVKSSDHLDYLLTYGKDVDEHQTEEDEKFKYFLDRTNKHIQLVQNAAAKIVKAYPEFDELLKQVEVHDASKFEEPELNPYIQITWRHKLEKEKGEFDPYNGKGYQTPGNLEKEEENQAALYHITTNSHHPEYWLEDKSDANVNKDDRDKSDKVIDASCMPDIDVAEMVADWVAMAEELGTNTAREWFNKQKDVRWHFSEHQEELIDRLLKVFE